MVQQTIEGFKAMFAAMLKAYIEANGITQSEMARPIGCITNTISKWLRGEFVPGPKYREALTGLLGAIEWPEKSINDYPNKEFGDRLRVGMEAHSASQDVSYQEIENMIGIPHRQISEYCSRGDVPIAPFLRKHLSRMSGIPLSEFPCPNKQKLNGHPRGLQSSPSQSERVDRYIELAEKGQDLFGDAQTNS